ncbi:MAG: hypothetical protein R3E66_20895 [bacterium]
MSQSFFAVTAPGLETILQAELRELGARKTKVDEGGVLFEATRKVFYHVLQHSRCANRVTMRLATFKARDFPDLFKRTKRQDWAHWIQPNTAIEVRASARTSRLIHTGRIQETVQDAIKAAVGLGDGPPQRVYARIVDDIVTLSLDAAGAELHFRGWRTAAVEAPLRENTAASCLRAMDWTPDVPLVDPTCGSGTIPLEAALWAAGKPTRHNFAAMRWANFDAESWTAAGVRTPAPTRGIWGSDIDEASIDAARQNAQNAAARVAWSVTPVGELVPPSTDPGLMLCNPPYGLRLPDTATRELIDVFAKRFKDWRLGFIMPTEFQPVEPTLEWTRVAQFLNGGIRVNLWGATHRQR